MTSLQNMMENNNPAHIQSIKRAIIIIEFLATQQQEEISLTEISKMLDWPKSTVHGILATLRDFNYIEQSDKTGYYRLGTRFFELGNIVSRRWEIADTALPVLKELNRQTGELVQLGTESDGKVLYLEKIEATNMLKIVSNVGTRLPMHCSGLGKALLAYMPEFEVERIVKTHGLQRFTNYTITSLPALREELALTRERGYAIDNNEIMEGLRCIAYPIFDKNGNAVYAVSVSGLSSHLTGKRLSNTKELLVTAANEISELLISNPTYQI